MSTNSKGLVMVEETTTYDCELLPYDDITKFPNLVNRCLRNLLFFLLHPLEALNRIPNSKAGGESWDFLVVILWPIYFVEECLKYASGHLSWLYDHHPHRVESTTWLGLALSLALFPVGVSIGLWIGAWMNHASLWLWRGLYNGFDTSYTARLTGFSYVVSRVVFLPYTIVALLFPSVGSIPFLDSILWFGFQCYVGVGLARTHGISVWRGVAASLSLPALFAGTYSLISHHSLLQILR